MPAGAFGAVRPVGAILPTSTAAGPSHSRSHGRLRRSEGPCWPVMSDDDFPVNTEDWGFPPTKDDCDNRRRIPRRRATRHHHIRKKASEMNQKPLQWR